MAWRGPPSGDAPNALGPPAVAEAFFDATGVPRHRIPFPHRYEESAPGLTRYDRATPSWYERQPEARCIEPPWLAVRIRFVFQSY